MANTNNQNSASALAVLALARECLRNSSQQTPDGRAIHSAVAQVSTTLSAIIGVAQSGKRNGDEQERRQWLAELDEAIARCGVQA